MRVPYKVEVDFELQTGVYETRVADVDDSDCVAVVIFKNFDKADVPTECQTVFLHPKTIDKILEVLEERRKTLEHEAREAEQRAGNAT